MRQPWQLLFLPGHAFTARLRSQSGRPRPEPPARLPHRDQAWRELRLPGVPGEPAYVCDLLPAARQVPGPLFPDGPRLPRAARSTSRSTAASVEGPVVVSMPPGGGRPTPFVSGFPRRRDRARQCRWQPVCRRSERRDLPRHALTDAWPVFGNVTLRVARRAIARLVPAMSAGSPLARSRQTSHARIRRRLRPNALEVPNDD